MTITAAPVGATAVATVSDGKLIDLAYNGGWRGEGDTTTAVAIALAESSGETYATNHYTENGKTYTVGGLWQLSTIHPQVTFPAAYVPLVNARLAYDIFKEQGWAAWATYTSGAYQQFMPRAQAAWNNASSGVKGAKGNEHPATSFSVAGINTPNWLGGFNNTSVLGTAASVETGTIGLANDIIGLFDNWKLVLLGLAGAVVGIIALVELVSSSKAAAATPTPPTT